MPGIVRTVTTQSWSFETYHLDLHHGFIAVIQEVTRLALIDSDDTKQKLSTQSQGHGRLVRRDDGLDAVCDIGLEDMVLGELALEVGGEPDAGERPALLEERLRIEHGGGGGVAHAQ